MAIPTITIDGTQLTGVSELDLLGPEVTATQTGDGGETTTARSKGRRVRVKIGTETVPDGAYELCLSAHAGIAPHTVVVVDRFGTTHTLEMNWKEPPPMRMRLPDQLESFEFTLTERP